MAGAGSSEQRLEYKRPLVKCVNMGIKDGICLSPYSGFEKVFNEGSHSFQG